MKWISVKDRLPTCCDRILICFEYVDVGILWVGSGRFCLDRGGFIPDSKDTNAHRAIKWIPLPEVTDEVD